MLIFALIIAPKNLSDRIKYYHLTFNPRWDNLPGYFYHYMLGFLMPGVHMILTLDEKNASGTNHYFISSFGKLMDDRFAELLDHLKVSYEFVVENTNAVHLKQAVCISPKRWDVMFATRQFYNNGSTVDKWKMLLKKLVNKNSYPGILYERSGLIRDIRDLRQRIFGLINTMPELNNDVLLLKRVDPTEEYETQSRLQRKDFGYGSKKRSLTQLQEGAAFLNNRGVDIQIYEPGYKPFVDQMVQFMHTKKLICIRGAELAHTILMPAGSRVVIIDNISSTRTTNPCVVLSEILDIRFEIIRSDKRPFVPLDRELLDEVIQRLD